MEGKKISFGFMKTKKSEKPVVEEKREFIECVEEKSIKVVGGETVTENAPLVIPMKPNTLITAERLKQIAEEVEKAVQEDPTPEEKSKSPINNEEPTENETLDQMAVRELLQEAKNEKKVETPAFTLPITVNPPIDGQKESTLDDYEAVPIQEFGMAMLRGMGWNPNKEQSKYKQPQLRPKGLGLGADKVVKENQKKNISKQKDEELSIVKNAYVKITIGKYSNCYGKVVSLDEDNGRVMVDIPVKKETVSLSEFMMQPVTKAEFDKQSRVINADAYEEYKRNEQKSSSSKYNEVTKIKEGTSSQKSKHIDNKDTKKETAENNRREYENSSNGRSTDKSQRNRRNSSSSEDRSKRSKETDRRSRRDSSGSENRSRQRKKEKRYSSNDSLSSLSDSDRRRKHKESKRRDDDSESDSSDSYKRHKKNKKSKNSTSDGKRDIDKKRKGKKKKRDRDRSPNYKKQKHRR